MSDFMAIAGCAIACSGADISIERTAMTPQQATLIPCPFCGGAARHLELNLGLYPERAICDTCDYSLSPAAWNCRAPAPTEPAVDRGLEAAAALVERKAAAYDAECGNTDPSTGTREYPGDGASWMMEMEELAEEIRALATPASPAVPAEVEPFKAMLIAMSGVQAVPARAPLGPMEIPEPGYSDSLADRIFNLPCQWKGDARLADAVLMGHTMACEQAFMLAYAASQPTSTPEAVNLLVEEAKRVIGKN